MKRATCQCRNQTVLPYPARTRSRRSLCSCQENKATGSSAIRVVAVSWLAIAWLVAAHPPHCRAIQNDTPDPADALAPYVAQLISPDYAVRQSAANTLNRLGADAFDALCSVRNSGDIEQRFAVERLLGQTKIDWAEFGLSKRVIEILGDYREQPVWRRKVRIEVLTRLSDASVVPALALLTRYELSPALSRYAAICLVKRLKDDEPISEATIAKVQSTIGTSSRTGCDWVRAAVHTVNRLDSIHTHWQPLVESVLRRDRATSRSCRLGQQVDEELVRWYVAELVSRGLEERAGEVAAEFVSICDSQPLSENTDWLVRLKLWEPLAKLQLRFENQFEQSGLLLYRLAHAEYEKGNLDAAEKLAGRANQALAQHPGCHLEAAAQLHQLGYHVWASREFQHVIETADPNSLHPVRARLLLSELHHDQLSHLQAASVLEPLAKQMQQGEVANEKIRKHIGPSPEQVLARHHYFIACHARQTHQPAAEKQHLVKGLLLDQRNLDLLIAADHCSDPDPELTHLVDSLVEAATQQLASKIQRLELNSGIPESKSQKQRARDLAGLYNRYAWLVSNTRGDQERAMKYARKAVAIRPANGHYLDTLARCRFATGDLQAAIRIQKAACRLLPGSRRTENQLEFYQRCRGKSRLADRNHQAPLCLWVLLR